MLNIASQVVNIPLIFTQQGGCIHSKCLYTRFRINEASTVSHVGVSKIGVL